MDDIKEYIRDTGIFSGFEDAELEKITDYFSIRKYKQKDIIISQDDIKKEFFIVLQGRVVSTHNLPGSIQRKRREFSRGDFFGEMSLFGGRPSFVAYVAAEDTGLLVMEESDIENLIEDRSKLAVKFTFQLLSLIIQRLRDSSRFLADVVQWGEDASRRVITDEMTGVYNRAFLEDAIESFFYISKNNNKPLSLLMLDIDNFREINSVGHEAGNKILLEYIEIIKDIVSRHGIIARYGGDEFMVLLPEADLEKALNIAEQIRGEVGKHDFSKYLTGTDYEITTSIGISNYPETATELSVFKEKADAALYRAKESGRNRVEYVK